MCVPESSDESEPSPHIEKLLEAANTASQTVAALHVAFMAFAAYFIIIVWGTSHEDLLQNSTIKLPILDVELPQTGFYLFVPWLLVLLHFNLLIQLELLSRKIWNLDSILPDTSAAQRVRDRLFIFPFTHLLAGRSSVRLIRWLLSMVVGLTVIALPLAMLLAAQIRFLPYHNEDFTLWQRLAVWVDVAMILTLWPLIASPNDSAREWWQSLWLKIANINRWIRSRWPKLQKQIIIARSTPKVEVEARGMSVLLVALLLVIPISFISPSIDKPDDTNTTLDEPDDTNTDIETDCTSLTLPINNSHRTLAFGFITRDLSLYEARLLTNDMPSSLLNRAIAADKSLRNTAFYEFDGLKLKKRNLHFANLSKAVLPKADLREADLISANLSGAQLQGVDLRDAHLKYTNLTDANLQEAHLNNMDLHKNILICTDLRGADLSDTHMENMDIRSIKLKGAILKGAHLKHSNMRNMDLQEAILLDSDLSWVDLQGANLQSQDLSKLDLRGADLTDVLLQNLKLQRANLSNAKLKNANLQGVDLSSANLEGVDLSWAKLQGSDLSDANLQGANLRNANLQGANLRNAHLQGADLNQAHLENANLSKADLLGINWSQANLDGLFLFENSMSNWDEDKKTTLEKPVKEEPEFPDFHKRLERASAELQKNKTTDSEEIKKLRGKPYSANNCYSDNPALLECKYRKPEHIDTYRATLHKKLIEIACSDSTIAEGIARRVIKYYAPRGDPDFGLVDVLLTALAPTKPCTGLTTLSKETLQQLQKDSVHKNIESAMGR